MSEKTFEIRLRGLVPTERLVDDLPAVELAEHEMRTVLTGRFVDQAALYGFLNLLRSYGLEVVDVRRMPTSTHGAETSQEGVGHVAEETE